MRDKQGIFILEAVEVLEDGCPVIVEAVVAPPLEIADLDGDLGKLEGVGIDFDGFQLLNSDHRFERKTELGGEGDHFLFQAKQQVERDVKKVSAAASGI